MLTWLCGTSSSLYLRHCKAAKKRQAPDCCSLRENHYKSVVYNTQSMIHYLGPREQSKSLALSDFVLCARFNAIHTELVENAARFFIFLIRKSSRWVRKHSRHYTRLFPGVPSCILLYFSCILLFPGCARRALLQGQCGMIFNSNSNENRCNCNQQASFTLYYSFRFFFSVDIHSFAML